MILIGTIAYIAMGIIIASAMFTALPNDKQTTQAAIFSSLWGAFWPVAVLIIIGMTVGGYKRN